MAWQTSHNKCTFITITMTMTWLARRKNESLCSAWHSMTSFCTDTRHKTETHGDHNQFTVKPVTRRGCRADTNGRIMIISLDRNQIWHCRNRRNEFHTSKLWGVKIFSIINTCELIQHSLIFLPTINKHGYYNIILTASSVHTSTHGLWSQYCIRGGMLIGLPYCHPINIVTVQHGWVVGRCLGV